MLVFFLAVPVSYFLCVGILACLALFATSFRSRDGRQAVCSGCGGEATCCEIVTQFIETYFETRCEWLQTQSGFSFAKPDLLEKGTKSLHCFRKQRPLLPLSFRQCNTDSAQWNNFNSNRPMSLGSSFFMGTNRERSGLHIPPTACFEGSFP